MAGDGRPRGRRGPRAGTPGSPPSTAPDALWLACSHGDVIKAIVADALGMHLDLFQRIVVEPASVTVIRYTPTRPFVLRLNDTGGDLAALCRRTAPAAPGDGASSDAAVGGGAGSVGSGRRSGQPCGAQCQRAG